MYDCGSEVHAMTDAGERPATWLTRARNVNPHALDALLALLFTAAALWNVRERTGESDGFRGPRAGGDGARRSDA